MDFVPYVTRGYFAPRHLSPLVDELEAIFLHREERHVVCHAPPRHGKTDTVLRFIAWCLWQRPSIRITYITYGSSLSREKSMVARDMCRYQLGVRLVVENLDGWMTPSGGGMWATGTGGPLTGKGYDLIIIDDPYKNRMEAESPTWRRRVMEWFYAVARTRLEPGGSIVVFATRWHPDDMMGTLISQGYKYIHLPALSDEGKALCPARFDETALQAIRHDVGEYTWESLYQGRPRPRGTSVFSSEVPTYTELPKVYRAAFGLDLSYSAKTSSDWSVAVKMLAANMDGVTKYFVADVIRRQVRAPVFKKACRVLHEAEMSAQWRWYTSTTEQGSADLFNDGGPETVPVVPIIARADKHTRAQRYAAAWNRGDVLLPKAASWLESFLAEHLSFTGVADDVDDQVDASVPAFDLLNEGTAKVDPNPIQPVVTGLAAEAM